MTLRAPLITPQPTRTGAAAPVLGSSMALLTAVAAAAAPFLNIDWSDPKFAPATTWQSLGSPQVLLTTGAPFAQLDWSPPKRPAPIAAPDQLHLAITEFANLTPFIPPDMSDGPYRAPNFLPTPQPYNLVLLSGTIQAPFAQFIWPNTTQVPGLAPPQLTRNINIFSEVPFSKLDWPSTFGVPDFAPPAPIPLNLELFTNPIPFPTPDMSAGPWHVSRFPLPAQPYNVTLLNGPVAPTPFSKTDWPPAWRPYLLVPQQQSLNLALLNLNPIPFAQYSWSQPIRLAGLPALQLPNISLLLSMPFNQTDWSKPQRAPAAPLIPAAYNIALYSVTATAPFVQTDWSRPFFPRSSPSSAQVQNMNFYPNQIPFVSTDRSRVVRVPLVGPPQSLPLNINLFTNPMPFNQLDWGRRFVPKLAPLQSMGNAQALSVRFVTFLSATTVTATLSTTRVSAMMSSTTGITAATSKTKVI